MRARIPIVLALAAVFAVACNDAPTQSVDVPIATAPEFNFMNGPATPGVVLRYSAGWAFQDMFPETPAGVPWFVQMGFAPGDVMKSCGGDGSSTPYSVQEVGAKGGEKVILNYMTKDARVTVFNWDDVLYYYIEALDLISQGEDIIPQCYWMERSEIVADGVAILHGNDGSAGTQFRANGTIDYMGETYRFKWLIKNPYTDKPLHVTRIW